MDQRGYPQGHSFENNSAASKSARNSSSFYARIKFLSLFFTPDETVDLSHQFQCYSDADLHYLAAYFRSQSMSLSDSQRSSYLSDLSRRSILSSSSTYSHDLATTENCAVERPTCELEPAWPGSYAESQSDSQLTTLSHSFQPSHQSLRNQDPAYSSFVTHATPTQKPFCFACNEQFKNKGSLSRHQKEQCEREKISACSLCPPPQPIYYTKERLLRHHVTSHGDKCPNGCSKKENKISIPCKEHLSENFEELPPKKAWGCPYCVSCFKTFEDWNGHCVDHLRKSDKATKWSFGTMIWSLLQQGCLMDARMRHDFPALSNWSSINEKTCSGLREILEHCRLPRGLRAREYWYLPEYDGVVRCAFNVIEHGLTFPSQQLFEITSKPIPYQISSSAGEGLKDVARTSEPLATNRNANSGFKNFPHSPDRPKNAAVTPTSVSEKTSSGPQTHSSPLVDITAAARSRPPEIKDADDIGASHTRKRGASLKRSLSNLAIRPSSSKSPPVQTVTAPPVPPLPDDAKVSDSDKAGAGLHHGGDWPAHTPYLDPIPQYRPMSGVVYDWSWSEGNQGQP